MTSDTIPNVRTLRRPAGGAPSAGRRFRANWPAELRGAGARLVCTVVDISSVGACLRLHDEVPNTARLRLIIGNVPPISVDQVWRKGTLLGLRFMDEQHWVLESYRKRFDPAAWLEKPPG